MSDMNLSLTISAALASGFSSAFSGVRGSLSSLTRASDQLRSQQRDLNREMRNYRGAASGLEALRRRYANLGREIDALRIRQERLNRSIANRDALRGARGETGGQIMGTMAMGAAIAAPAALATNLATEFQAQLRDVRITGEFGAEDEERLGRAIRESALQYNQEHTSISAGVGTLTAGGISTVDELEKYIPTLTKATTATKADMDDLAKVSIALRDNMAISADDTYSSFNMLAKAGKEGRFELVDMARHLPSLTAQYKALGYTGKDAVAEMGAALQIAIKGAGSPEEAANNYKNFLAKVTSPESIKTFGDAGIDLQKSLIQMREKGLSPLEGMLDIITYYMASKSPSAAKEFQAALKLEDQASREAAVNTLVEAYALGDLFRDMQVQGFLKPALQNRDELKRITAESKGAANADVLGKDFDMRMESTQEKQRAAMQSARDLGLSIGNILTPSVKDFLDSVTPMINSVNTWVKQNPETVVSIMQLVGGLIALKLGFLGFKFGVLSLLSPFASLITGIRSISAGYSAMRILMAGGRMSGLFSRFLPIGRAISGLCSGLAGLAMRLGGVLGGALFRGGMMAGRAIIFIARALLMNPIGLAVTAIAGGAYLIWRNWDKIVPWFKEMWGKVKAVFSEAWSGIKNKTAQAWGNIKQAFFDYHPIGMIIKNWEPITRWFGALPGRLKGFADRTWTNLQQSIAGWQPFGLVTRQWQPLTRWFGALPGRFKGFADRTWSNLQQSLASWQPFGLVTRQWQPLTAWFGALPGRFKGFGSDIVNGLSSGISSLVNKPLELISGLGDKIKNKFKSIFGISSPSKVFRSFGSDIIEGLIGGISALLNKPLELVSGLGDSIKSKFKSVLGISSPSRVFMGFGSDIVQGASLGIDGKTKSAWESAKKLGTEIVTGFGNPKLSMALDKAKSAEQSGAARSAAGAAMTIQFSPQITVNGGGEGGVQGQVKQALEMSYREFERLMRQYQQRTQRRSFGEI